jgi:hypothetical protein
MGFTDSGLGELIQYADVSSFVYLNMPDIRGWQLVPTCTWWHLILLRNAS